MKKNNILVSVVLLLLSAGCHIDDGYRGTRQQPLPEKSAPVNPATTVADESFSAAAEVNVKLRVKILGSNSEMDFCNKLIGHIGGGLLSSNIEFTGNAAGDAEIVILPEFEVVDNDGAYHRVVCRQVSAEIKYGKNTFAMKNFYPQAQPRKQGLQNAKNQYVQSVAELLIPFLRSELDRLANNELAVSEVSFDLKNQQQKIDRAAIAAQVEKINQVLISSAGVVKFMNISQNSAAARCTFRVVYQKRMFPQGIINYLNLKLAGK